MSEHDELCWDREGTPYYRQCVCFPVRMAREAERKRIKDGVKELTVDPGQGWYAQTVVDIIDGEDA